MIKLSQFPALHVFMRIFKKPELFRAALQRFPAAARLQGRPALEGDAHTHFCQRPHSPAMLEEQQIN